MNRLLIVGTSENTIAEISLAMGMTAVLDIESHLYPVPPSIEKCSAVLLLLDDAPEQYLSELEQYSLGQISPANPLIIGTKDPNQLAVRQAIRRGAIDYLDLNIHNFLIRNRINNVMNLRNPQATQSDAVNRLLFYRCIGPAMMLEVSKDESLMHAALINGDFYQAVGIPKDYYEKSTNLFDTVLPEEIEETRRTVHTAIKEGVADCLFSNPATGQTFRATYRLLLKNDQENVLLMTLSDVTDRQLHSSMNENMLRLPGMTMFTYDPETDSVHFRMVSKKNQKTSVTHTGITNPNKQKFIAPESFLLIKRTIREALETIQTGNIDVRLLFGGELKWYRMYYKSVPDSSGRPARIVGRLDDVENTDYIDVSGIHSGLCDAETHLPTYGTTMQFVDQVLHEHNQGTMMLLYISGLKKASEYMEETTYQIFLQNVVRTMNNLFIATDLFGRFDEECFMIFMPEATSRNLVPKKAQALINAVKEILPDNEFSVNIGICIVDSHHGSLQSIVNDANIALWTAIEEGKSTFRIFENTEI